MYRWQNRRRKWWSKLYILTINNIPSTIWRTTKNSDKLFTNKMAWWKMKDTKILVDFLIVKGWIRGGMMTKNIIQITSRCVNTYNVYIIKHELDAYKHVVGSLIIISVFLSTQLLLLTLNFIYVSLCFGLKRWNINAKYIYVYTKVAILFFVCVKLSF